MDNSHFKPENQRNYLTILKDFYHRKLINELSLEELQEKLLELQQDKDQKLNLDIFTKKATRQIGAKAFAELKRLTDQEVLDRKAA
tara:strand:+ start:225 stop:482 length:258 start_codon:yes stop_codon:yes gene_type:complete